MSSNFTETDNRPVRPFWSKSRLIGLVALLSVPVLAYMGLLFYFFAERYDFPIRISGHEEKGGSSRPFTTSPDGTTMVFASRRTGHGDLYMAGIDGKNVRRLTSNPEYECDPCYSPDGRSILFCREADYCGHIWIMDADGRNQRQLTFGSDYDDGPIFTPKGDHIWFQRSPQGMSPGHYFMFSMTTKGKEVQPIVPLHKEWIRQVAVSPQDGSVYYVVSNYGAGPYHQIWRMQADGTNQHKLADGDHPAISSDGSQVAYLDGSGGTEVWMMKPDGSQQHRVYTSKELKSFVGFARGDHELTFLEELSSGPWISAVDTKGLNYHRIVNVL